MITSVENLVDSLEKDQKIIMFLQGAYKEKTGEDVFIPEHIEQKEKESESLDTFPNQRFLSFKDKVVSLNLPSASDKNAKGRIEKLRKLKDTSTLITKLDLSYFAEKNISVELLKRVIEGLRILKSVEYLNLSHNNLTDMYIDVITDFILIPNLTQINLSYNQLTKDSVKKLTQTIAQSKKLRSIDVSYNPFNTDPSCCSVLCNSLKNCDKLYHFGICDSSRDSGLRIMTNRPSLESLNLEDSSYRKFSYESLSRYLSSKRYDLKYLSLKFCNIEFLYGAQYIAHGLRKNQNLRKLNLYGTGLTDFSGMRIIKAITDHKFLYELNLGDNFLSTNFCIAFAEVMTVNNVINTVIITKNYRIINKNFAFILSGLLINKSMFSLGDLTDTKIGVKYRESAEELLSYNKQFGCWRQTGSLETDKKNFFLSNVFNQEFLKYLNETKVSLNDKSKNSLIDKTNESLNDKTENLQYDNEYNESINNILSLLEKTFKRQSLQMPSNHNINPDINDVIDSFNFSMINNFGVSNKSIESEKLTRSTLFKDKFTVKYSIPGAHYLKDYQNALTQVPIKQPKTRSTSKKKKKVFATSRGKGSKKKKRVSPVKPKVNTLNIVASIIQEVIDNEPSLLGLPTEENKEDIYEGYERIRFANDKPYIDQATKTKIAPHPEDNMEFVIDKSKEDAIREKYAIRSFMDNVELNNKFVFNNYS